jgi:phosphatidylinositol-3-phosphatase
MMNWQVLCRSLLLGLLVLASTVSATPMNNIKNVFVIVFENHNWSSIIGTRSAPYINKTLLPMASHAKAYYSPPGLHPSLPNYLWIEAGTNFGIADDNDPSVNARSTTAHLVTQLAAAGVSWKSYQEDIPGTNCPLTAFNLFTPRHNPMLYFRDVTNNNNFGSVYCIKHVRPFSELAADLRNNTLPQYVFITPNVCNDGHDACAPLNNPIAQTDAWLKNNLPMLLNSSAYKNAGAIFITWDEAEKGDVPIGMIVLSPFAKGNGYSNSVRYTHGSLLRTVQEIFGVSPLLGDAAKQSSLSDLFQ